MPGAGDIRAGRAFVELFAEDNKLYRALDRAQARLQGFGGTLQRIGTVAGLAGGSVFAPLAKAFADSAGRAADIDQLAKRYGTTTQEVSALAYAFERSGAGMDDFKATLDGLATSISSAADGADDSFRRLGLNAKTLIRLPLPESLEKVVDALGRVTLEEDRLKYANEFGLGGMLDLVRKGSAGLAQLKREAADAGAVIDPEAAARSRAVMQEYAKTWQAVTYAILETGMALLPTAEQITGFGDRVRGWIGDAREWLRTNGELIATVATVAGVVAGAGAALVALGTVATGVGTGIGVVVTVLKAGFALVLPVVTTLVSGLGVALGALLTPAGAVAAALAGLGYLFLTQTDTGREFCDTVKSGFAEAAATAKEAWDGIAAAIRKGDLLLAGKIALAALNLEWSKAVLWWTRKWNDFKSTFVDGWYDVVAVVKKALIDLGAFIARSTVGALGELFQVLARGADKLGLAEWAGHLRSAADAMGVSAAAINQVRDEGKAAVDAQRARLQAAADAARQASEGEAVADVAAADQRFRELVAKARAEGRAPVGAAAEGLEGEAADRARYETYLRQQAAAADKMKAGANDLFRSVKGTFALPAAQQQLGYGDTAKRKIVDGVGKIAQNAAALPQIAKGVADLNKKLAFA